MKFIRGFFSLALFLAGMCPVFGAVTFTNTPVAVSNTYSGFITLQIGGLTSGDTVVVRKFLDVNTNGIVDSADQLVQQFNLTDNQPGQVIGNVTNYNVPGDTNMTAGAIGTSFAFNNGDFVQNLVGKYRYVLSSPAGHFSPLTNSFIVTNFPFAQKFTGNVVSNNTSVVLSNAIVLLFPPPSSGHGGPGQPLAGTVANNAGVYTIAAPPGTYTLVAFRTNFVGNLDNAPVLTLGSGLTVTTNLTLTNATASISGSFVDSTNNAVKLPGIFMPFSGNSLLSVTFSDTNGNYAARVTSGQWSFASDDTGLIIHGYVGSNNGTNVNAGASGVVVPFPRANAMFYGSVKDNLGNPIANVDIGASDTVSNLYDADGYSDPNGNYFVGALGLGSGDPWELGFSGENTALTNYIVSQPQFDQNGGTNLAIGTAVLQNFTVILATNTISGSLKDNNNNPLTNIQIFASANISGLDYSSQANTDVNGDYSINVANGTWNVSASCGGGQNSLPGNYQCPNSATVTILNNSVVTNFVAVACGGVQIVTPSPLPLGETNLFYNQNLEASSCNPGFTWLKTGGTLPPGLSFNSSGDLSGTPTTPGVFLFTVQVTDSNSATTNQLFSLTISNGVSIATTVLTNGVNGLNYSNQLQAVNGLAPYNWALSSGSLPANLSLSDSGLIFGNAAVSGLFNFTVQVTDNLGGTATQPLSLTLVNTNIPPLAVGTVSSGQIVVLWPASAGTNFTLQMTTNLQTGPWVPATNGVLQNAYSFTNSSPAAFFRLQ